MAGAAFMTAPSAYVPGSTPAATPQNFTAIEETLGTALRDFASELRLTDAADFAAFIRLGQMANLRSIVQSSAEFFFKPGTLELAEPGELDLEWFAPPVIILPMMFRHKDVRVYFRLRLAAINAAVEVESAAVPDGAVGDALLLQLREALQGAQATKRALNGACSG
jgi:hypothetical protein